MSAPPRRTFLLRLQPEHNNDATIRGLRWLLKTLWRRYALRCISIEEVRQ
jgi:hypothetical protein